MKKPIIKDFKFEGIDFWSRPVFKSTINETRIGSVDILFPDKKIAPNNTPEEISDYFRKNTDQLLIFGVTFNEDDPLGSPIGSHVTINILP